METATETVTVTKYVLTLTETEVAAILVDPAAFQQRLRALRGQPAPTQRELVRCECGHTEPEHTINMRGEPVCMISSCGCSLFKPAPAQGQE